MAMSIAEAQFCYWIQTKRGIILAMFRWITKTRLRTALVLVFFLVVLIVSLLLIIGFHDVATSGIGAVTAIISAAGTVSTVILAWRADRRSAKESDLKVIQMQQQIAELESKLKASQQALSPISADHA
jgi:hypothetical protein